MIKVSVATLAVLLLTSRSHAADEPAVGATLTIPVVSVSVSVTGSAVESKRAVYAPPPGWHVRSHRVVTSQKRGAINYSVSTVPAGWTLRAEERAAAEGKASATAAISSYKVSTGGHASAAQASTVSGYRADESSHHLLMVEVIARGPGLWKGESGVELTVVADLVYIGR